jgi:hypothetical protein
VTLKYAHQTDRASSMNVARRATVLLSLVLLASMVACRRSTQRDPESKILFTQVPERNSRNQNKQDVMEGTVSSAKKGQRLVIYSKSGGLWWVQPLVTSPFTPILADGVWRNETHLGASYAVMLVDAGYQPAAVLNQLPANQNGVAAVAETLPQEKSSSHFVDFSGFNWRVRFKPSDRGGAVNPYDPENVYVDQAGALHLRIMNRDGHWSASEVSLTQSLGYGTYSFTVEDVSKLDPSTVFGIFTWDYATDHQYNREFDINISRWGDPAQMNAEFVLQPLLALTNSTRFIAPSGRLKYTIVWEPGRLTMSVAPVSPLRDAPVVAKHTFTSGVPAPGFESFRMTFYPYTRPNLASSSFQGPAEVIVDQFEYLP